MYTINIDFLPSYASLIDETLHAEDLYTGLLRESLASEAGFRSFWNHLDTNGFDGESNCPFDSSGSWLSPFDGICLLLLQAV